MDQLHDNPEAVSKHKKIAFMMLVLSISALCIVPVLLLPFIISHLESVLPYDLFYSLLTFDQSVSSFIKGIIPFDVGIRIINLVAIGIFVLLFFIFNYLRKYNSDLTSYSGSNISYSDMKYKHVAYDTSKPAAASKENFETDIGLNTNKRKDLVKLFAQTKKKLDKMGQDLAFLSIDVADSTGMKVGEEKASIEHDFREYKYIVEKAIKTHGSIKSAWTPDGVMICFPTIEGAVNTARDIIKGLKDFNANIKTIKKDFTIRCGVNFGRVYCDESTPMEEMSDRVIDITGHMQKYALPDSIFMDKALVWSLEDRSGFSPADKEVDGYDVFVWKEGG